VIGGIGLAPNPQVPTAGDLRFCIAEGSVAHRFYVIVPNTFPIPFRDGQEVAFQASASGGGPNRHVNLLIRDDAGALLFAVGTPAAELDVSRGRRVRTRRANGYREHVHQVVFTHSSGLEARVAPGSWARISTPDGDFLLWGSAVERVLDRGAPARPDYVGGWLDFAIVRSP